MYNTDPVSCKTLPKSTLTKYFILILNFSFEQNGKKKSYFHFGTINPPQKILEENPPIPQRPLGPKPKSLAELQAGDKPFNPSGNKTKRRTHDFLCPHAEFMACPYS